MSEDSQPSSSLQSHGLKIAVLAIALLLGAAVGWVLFDQYGPRNPVLPPPVSASFLDRANLWTILESALPEGVTCQNVGGGAGSGGGGSRPGTNWWLVEAGHRNERAILRATDAELNSLLTAISTTIESELRKWQPDLNIQTSISPAELTTQYLAADGEGNYDGKIVVKVEKVSPADPGFMDGKGFTHNLELRIDENRWGLDPRTFSW